MSTPGLAFALLTTLSWSIGIFPFTVAARAIGANALNHFRLPLAMLMIMLIALFASGPVGFADMFTGDHAAECWFWLGLSGLIGLTVGDHFGFHMYAILGARLGSVLTTFAPGAALVTGYFLNGERLSLTGIAGMVITVTGVIVLALSREERDRQAVTAHGSVLKGIIYGIIAAFCQGAGLVLAKKGLTLQAQSSSPFHATFIRLTAATVSLFAFTILSGRIKSVMAPIRQHGNHAIRPAVIGTLFGPVLGVSFSLFTVSFLDASVAQTIFSLVPVVTLLISAVIHGEPIRPKMAWGVVVAVAGVILLVWRDSVEHFIFNL